MRVCMVTSELAPFCGWGVGTSVGALASALARAGHEVTLLAPDHPRLRERFADVYPHLRLVIQPEPARPCLPAPEVARSLAVYESLKSIHADRPQDLVLFNDFLGDGYVSITQRASCEALPGAVLGVQLHCPLSIIHAENGHVHWDHALAAIEHMELVAIRRADLVVSPSQAMLNRLARAGAENQRTVLVRNVLDDVFCAAETAAPAPGPPEVVFVGRLERLKGVEELVDAAVQVLAGGDSFTLRLVGGDTPTAPASCSMREHLQRRVPPAFRDRIVFQGTEPRGEVRRFLESAAVFAAPSRWDNFPCSVMEAMACGRAVVCSDAGGLPELVHHGVSGIVVPSGNTDRLAAAIRTLLRDEAVRLRLGSAASERVRSLCAGHAAVASLTSAVEAIRVQSRPARLAPAPQAVTAVIRWERAKPFPEGSVRSLAGQTQPAERVLVLREPGALGEPSGGCDVLEACGPRGGDLARVLHECSTPFLLLLDSLHRPHPDFVKACAAAMARDLTVAGASACMSCGEEGSPSADILTLGAAAGLLPVADVALPTSALLRCGAVRAVGGFDATLPAGECWELHCRLVKAGWKLAVLADRLLRTDLRGYRPGLGGSGPDAPAEAETQHAIRAGLAHTYADLNGTPGRTAQLLLSEALGPARNPEHAARAMEIVHDNLRYRLADRVDGLVRGLGLRAMVKRALLRTDGDAR